MQAQRPLHLELASILDKTEIWFIHGNHDTDTEADHDHLFGSAMADRNLHGRVVEIAGLRIAGLGGVFRCKVWTPPAPAIRFNPDYLASSAHYRFEARHVAVGARQGTCRLIHAANC